MIATQCLVASLVLATAANVDVDLPRGLLFEGNASELQVRLDMNDQLVKEFEDGNYQSTAEVQRSVAHCPQVCDEWCWATSATMCASAFGGSTNCASQEAKAAGKEFGGSCDTSCSSHCNQGGYDYQIADAISYLSGHRYQTGNMLSQSALDNALKSGPITMHINWSGGGGHAVVVESVSGGRYTGFDPWPVKKGTSISAVSYSSLAQYQPRYGGKGKWVATVYTTSSASMTV